MSGRKRWGVYDLERKDFLPCDNEDTARLLVALNSERWYLLTSTDGWTWNIPKEPGRG